MSRGFGVSLGPPLTAEQERRFWRAHAYMLRLERGVVPAGDANTALTKEEAAEFKRQFGYVEVDADE